ncbi:solute carrier organic anion transporter family member 74D-like [Planococcus citri]|uniref:solute carrier organic anion transporter family member 74D-like n=1 Tax=Planococcus citri TaxID=170843 RepID=UPI0031F7C945
MSNKHDLKARISDRKKENSNKKGLETKSIVMDTECGIGCFFPKWLQFLASKKTFVIVYALTGMQANMLSAYYVGTMSTVEKNFNMSSRMSGIISASWDIGTVVANLILSYAAATGHRTRWVAFGMLIVSFSSFMRVLPYHIFGGGETIMLYTKEYETQFNSTEHLKNNLSNSTSVTYLRTSDQCEQSDTKFPDMVAFYTFVAAQFLMGIGTSMYWTCGIVYLDDNVRKNIAPFLFALSQAIKLLGPTIGFFLSSYFLKIYLVPTLTPTITNEDPRWIGAWWIGWYPIGILGLICAFAMALFPKMLPRAALRKVNDDSISRTKDSVSISDFMKRMKRICKNKVVVFNSMSSVSFVLGLMAYWTFMPKYMESQFRLSPSQSNFITGTVSILSNGLGILAAGLFITTLKPSPRFLAGWNVFVEFLDVLGRFGYILLSCPDQTYHGHLNNDNSWNLTEVCNEKFNCGTDIQYAPVCDSSRDVVFYSSCHAGCTSSSLINGTLIYNNCSCVPDVNTVVMDGMCPVDCSMNIVLLIAMMSVLGFTSATGRSANTLIQFRCVEERDKSMSIGVTETLLAILAYTPAPILYGIIMDWTCIVWGDNCGSRGNCWIYDNKKLRLGFNLTSAGFLFVGTILDCFVWYYVKGVKMYDEDFLGDSKKSKTAHQALAEKFEENEKLRNDSASALLNEFSTRSLNN